MEDVMNESISEVSKPGKVKRSYSRKQTKTENTIADLIPQYPNPVEEVLGNFEEKPFSADDEINKLKLRAVYNNYITLFPEKQLPPLNTNWDVNELNQRIKYARTVSSMTLNTVSTVNMYLIELVTKFVEIFIKTITKNKINIDGLSNDLKTNADVQEALKLIVAEYVDVEILSSPKIRLGLTIGYLCIKKSIENSLMPTEISLKNINVGNIKEKFNNL